MRTKREKSEMQALAKEKKKEELDAILSQYGGLWQSVDDMVKKCLNSIKRKRKQL